MGLEKVNHIDIEALIPAEERAAVFQSAIKKSKVLPLMTRLPDMSTNKERLKIEDVLPFAYWVSGSQGLKRTTKVSYKDKYIYAEKLAAIVPIAIDDLEDENYDLWGNVRPRLEEAIYKVIDAAVLFGANKPASFPDGIVDLAFNRGHQVVQQSGETFYSVISRAMGKVEKTGYSVTGLLGGLGIKEAFRNLLDTTGQLITGSEINALPKFYVDNGAWDDSEAQLIVGDFSQAVYSVRKDISFKLFTEATITDPTSGETIYLAQQNMVALLAEIRIGWQMPEPAVVTGDDRYAFAVVVPSATSKISLIGPESAEFEDAVDVSLAANVLGAKIYYTDNGDTPDATKTLYTGPIHLTATKTIKAIAVYGDYTSSDVYSATFQKAPN